MNKHLHLSLAFVGVVAAAMPTQAKIVLGTPFSPHAVLQRKMSVPVWGKAPSGMKIEVSFGGECCVAQADSNGCWCVRLPPMEACDIGRGLVVRELGSRLSVEKIEVPDVLVGEVWFASGQSNMECPLWGENPRFRDANGVLVAEMTRLPKIRYVKNELKWSVNARPIRSTWRQMTAENLREQPLSAIAFYYARELFLALNVPVGIVDSSWGGTNIDAWTPRCGYVDCDQKIAAVARYEVKKNWNKAEDSMGPIYCVYQQPTVIFNGMVASWAPMAMKGLIWYQGCNNSGESHLYCAKMHALYNGWSRCFNNPDMKLYFVQLAPYTQNWMGIVQAQNRFAKEQPNAAIVVTSDIGNFHDIHPNRKEIVAKRLAVHALKRDYGFPIQEDDSPVFQSASFRDFGAVLTFDNVKSWYLYTPDNSLNAPFELAGTNGVWHAAKVVNLKKKFDKRKQKEVPLPILEGSRIEVECGAVQKPVRVRYMGEPRTSGTLYNEMSLPLGPFEM